MSPAGTHPRILRRSEAGHGDYHSQPGARARSRGWRGRRRPWAILAAGQRAAMGTFLAFTRAQEPAPIRPERSLSGQAGISGRGRSTSSRSCRTRSIASRSIATEAYDRTHPLSTSVSRRWTEIYRKDPAWNRTTDPALEARFQRVKAKLIGFVTIQGGGHRLSGEQPERPGTLRPRLRLSPRGLSR